MFEYESQPWVAGFNAPFSLVISFIRKTWSRLVLPSLVCLPLALAGCGGGGGGGGAEGSAAGGGGGSGGSHRAAQSASTVQSWATEPTDIYALGTTSTETAAHAGLFFGTDKSQSYRSIHGTFYSSLKAAQTQLNLNTDLPIASRDTHAPSQWSQGWTGKNTMIGVVDTFSDNHSVDTHGERVSLIINSVAPEAEIIAYAFDYTTASAERAWERMNANQHFIANNSFGRTKFDDATGEKDTSFDRDVGSRIRHNYKATGLATYDEKMLFVFAAGNAGMACPDKRVDICDFRAAITHGLRQAGHEDEDAMIWVGALTDYSDRLASFSLKAGRMQHDFIVAHDDVLAKGDGSGTSYSTPRVAGAAALIRQKFPELSGFQIKSVLLETATDIGEPGVDEVFGYGKLDLQNAMSPQGALSAQ
jgi:subtilisin family serine protease